MANLFWKAPKGTKALLDRPFKTEDEFERTIFETSELLEDIFLLKRQVRGGGKTGIPDIIGVDGDGNICIIELKNVAVDASIIPQVLQYAIWAETHPDSIKNLWLERDNKPDETQPTWESMKVRIIVIAPSIHRSTITAVSKINYTVDLLEVKRWIEGKDEFLLVNTLEEDTQLNRHVRPVSGLRNYDADFYRKERNSKSVTEFMRYADDLQSLVVKKGWLLERKFNRGYCGFKAGFFNAFGIGWWGTRSFGFFVKISKEEAAKFSPKPCDYSVRWKEACYPIEPGKTKVTDLLPILDFAYHKVAGTTEE